MEDAKTIERIDLMHPALRDELRQIYKEICATLTGGAFCRFAYTLRTFKEQDDLYAIGRTKGRGVVTNAKGGESYHNYGLAVDIVLMLEAGKKASWEVEVDFDGDKTPDWMEVVKIFKSHGWEWGGDWKFKDLPHFQKTGGKKIKDLQALYKAKKFIPNTEYVQL